MRVAAGAGWISPRARAAALAVAPWAGAVAFMFLTVGLHPGLPVWPAVALAGVGLFVGGAGAWWMWTAAHPATRAMAARHARLRAVAGAKDDDVELIGSDGAVVFAADGHHRVYRSYRALVRFPADSPPMATADEVGAADIGDRAVADVFVLPDDHPVVVKLSSTVRRYGRTLVLDIDTERPDRTAEVGLWAGARTLRARARANVAAIEELDALLAQVQNAPRWPAADTSAGSSRTR